MLQNVVNTLHYVGQGMASQYGTNTNLLATSPPDVIGPPSSWWNQQGRDIAAPMGVVVGGSVSGLFRGGSILTGEAQSLRALSGESQRAVRSLEKQILAHQKKLDEFKNNPTIRPGMEHLPIGIIEKQQQVRIRHLETEIRTFQNNIDKILNGDYW